MRHEEAMERMLEADPAELVGESDTPLAAHLRECARCGALGRRLLEEQAHLARELEAARPRGSATEAVERVLAEETPEADRFRWVSVLAPLAAAAVVAAILLWTPGDERPDRVVPPASASSPAPVHVSVNVPDGGALVFATRDPAVTLIWIERPEGETR